MAKNQTAPHFKTLKHNKVQLYYLTFFINQFFCINVKYSFKCLKNIFVVVVFKI